MDRSKKRLELAYGGLPKLPDVIPTNTQDLLDLMDHAAEIAGSAQGATAPAFDHGMRVFNQLYAHYQLHVSMELGAAHRGLERATNALKVATWWLGGITFLLGGVELWKMAVGH